MNGGVKVFGLLTLSIPLVFIVTRYYSSLPQPKDKYKKRFEEEEEQVGLQVIDGASMNNVWSSLDPNLLGEILSRLCLTDQARFLVVCKNWLAAAHPIINSTSSKSAAALPWHGCIVPGSSQVQIYDPLSSPNHLVSVENILWSKLGIPSPSPPFASSVKHNWVFLCIRKSNLFFWRRRYIRRYVLMYSPFTRRFITLPKFDYPRRFSFWTTFSTQPDSPDCVFCLIDAKNADKIAVITYTNGDKEWTAREFNIHPHFIPGTCYPLILCGILYIVSTFGQVASYNILHGEFNFESLFLDDLLLANRYAKMKMKSFVFNGELMILWYNGNAALPGGQQCVRRYDRSLKVWIPVSTLSDYALFFSENIIDVSVINTKDMRYNGVLSNKIYHFLNGGCLVYSLEDGNLVRFKSINSNLLEDGGGELPKYKYNYGIQDPPGYWLEAPCVRSSSDNQVSIAGRNFVTNIGMSLLNMFSRSFCICTVTARYR